MARILTLFWNRDENRLRALWRLLLQIALMAAAAAILQVGIGLPLTGLFRQWWPGQAQSLSFTLGTILIGGGMVLGTWLAGRFLDRRYFVDFGFHVNDNWWRDLSFGLALGAFLMMGIFVVEWIAGWIVITDTFRPDYQLPFGLAILVPVVAYISVGIYEELFSRGYQLRNLAEGLSFEPLGARGGILLAWLLSSIVFGGLHMGNPNATLISTANIILAGLFLGLGYILTGELAIPIGLHISWNFFQGNVFGFPVSGTRASQATFIAVQQQGPDLWTGGSFGPEAGLIGIAALLVGSLSILLWVWRQSGQMGLERSITRYLPRRSPSE